MKYKFLIPTIAICMGSSLLVGSVRADDKDTTVTTYDQKTPVNVSQVLHARVLDRSGQKIGDVEDIIVEPTSGKAEFAVIKLSGDLADNGKYTPVPFSLLKFSDTQKKDIFGHRDLILQTDRDKLMSASRFSTKTWPERVSWGQDVYAYYGVPWDSSFGQGGTGASINSTSGSGLSTVTVTEPAPGSVTVMQPAPRSYTYYEYREVQPERPRGIDNGTGPDGKDTFHLYFRPWPYHDLTDTH